MKNWTSSRFNILHLWVALKIILTSQSFSSKKQRYVQHQKKTIFLMWTTCTTYSSQNNWKHQKYPWEELYFSVSSKQLKLDDKNLTMLPALKSDRLKKFYGSFSQGNFWLPNKIGKIYRLDLFCLQKHWQLMAQKSINKWAPQVRLSIRHGRVKKQKKLFLLKDCSHTFFSR